MADLCILQNGWSVTYSWAWHPGSNQHNNSWNDCRHGPEPQKTLLATLSSSVGWHQFKCRNTVFIFFCHINFHKKCILHSPKYATYSWMGHTTVVVPQSSPPGSRQAGFGRNEITFHSEKNHLKWLFIPPPNSGYPQHHQLNFIL